ncbi:DUF2635 domain-containing protein [Glaesserella parasuis]|uniref:DUF2635 domain-containing protein n=1 Tax=Glaesserella parasuis TaxID=738 RepID=UPI0021BFE461|nr:DUF2635 domain-containing protein [Glaesserella parasuis]MCT8749583.1 DUF2635 domain-containing protein [Glaesserella parasuis]MDE4023249.1 DUF2635 domain-containing protein [Glaesserella parasuis]MDG6830304.1 DUF2635 domain-containing protein [Glaesserella parasuis]MDG6851987.1 DUF2635 domain-containing protein [Glaesserella parasuis]
MKIKVKVKAIDGVRVPFENHPHRYIEHKAVEVDNSIYYQRRIADGDLILVTGVDKPKKESK